jgi:hypothetical protein
MICRVAFYGHLYSIQARLINTGSDIYMAPYDIHAEASQNKTS